MNQYDLIPANIASLVVENTTLIMVTTLIMAITYVYVTGNA
jgi:hypothetical protein